MNTISYYEGILSGVLQDACDNMFINLPKLVLTINKLFVDCANAHTSFHGAKNGYAIFSIKSTTFMLTYPPRTSEIRVYCRHSDAIEWQKESILTAKDTKELIKFMMDAVENPPHPCK